MKLDFLKQDGGNLVLFVSGYGQDLNTFKRFVASLAQDTALAVIYDYEADGEELNLSLFKEYARIRVIAWSMGVMFAPAVLKKDSSLHFEKCIAVNGTVEGIDEEFGIPESVWDETIASMDDEHALNFIRLMCRSPALIEDYLKNRPERSVESLKSELIYIREYASGINARNDQDLKDANDSFYDLAYSSKRDLIMPHAAVVKSFERMGVKCEAVAGAHFVPELFQSLICEPFTHD